MDFSCAELYPWFLTAQCAFLVAYCLILSSVGEPETMGRSRLKETMSDDEGFEQEGGCSCGFLNKMLSQKGLTKFT